MGSSFIYKIFINSSSINVQFAKNQIIHEKKIIILFSTLLIGHLQINAQNSSITISGNIKDKNTKESIALASVILKKEDGKFIAGTISNDKGLFSIANIKPGSYLLETSLVGYQKQTQSIYVGSMSAFLDLPSIEMASTSLTLDNVTISAKANDISSKLDKKTYSLSENVSQSGGSILQNIQNLPSITVQENKILLRGSDKVLILIDGKQTALTGFGSQSGLDNLSAANVDKVEILNNPSAKYDANGNAGIINIVMKKSNQEGLNGKIGLTTGLGSLWVRQENLPSIRP